MYKKAHLAVLEGLAQLPCLFPNLLTEQLGLAQQARGPRGFLALHEGLGHGGAALGDRGLERQERRPRDLRGVA